MGPTALLPPPKEGVLRNFFALKIRRASAGCEPATLGTKGQHATSRPTKPLASRVSLPDTIGTRLVVVHSSMSWVECSWYQLKGFFRWSVSIETGIIFLTFDIFIHGVSHANESGISLIILNNNEDIATRFEQDYFRCVRNEEECVCSVCLFRCNIFIGIRIINPLNPELNPICYCWHY